MTEPQPTPPRAWDHLYEVEKFWSNPEARAEWSLRLSIINAYWVRPIMHYAQRLALRPGWAPEALEQIRTLAGMLEGISLLFLELTETRYEKWDVYHQALQQIPICGYGLSLWGDLKEETRKSEAALGLTFSEEDRLLFRDLVAIAPLEGAENWMAGIVTPRDRPNLLGSRQIDRVIH